MIDYAGPGLYRRGDYPERLDIALEAIAADPEQARRDWTAIYDLLLLGRIRTAEEIDVYDEPPPLG